MVKINTLLLAGVAAASPLGADVNSAKSGGKIAVFNNCPYPVYGWDTVIPNDNGSQRSGVTMAKGLSVNEIPEQEYVTLRHLTTSPNGYADHNTKQFAFGFNNTAKSLTMHTNLHNVFGEAKWPAAVAAVAAVGCVEGGEVWQYQSTKHYEGKGHLECRGHGNKITSYYWAWAYALCAKAEDFVFDKADGELKYKGQPVGLKM